MDFDNFNCFLNLLNSEPPGPTDGGTLVRLSILGALEVGMVVF